MAEARPRVWVSQPLFDDIVARLHAHFDVVQVPDVSEHGAGQIAAAHGVSRRDLYEAVLAARS